MSDVYVVGTDMIRFGRFPEKSVPQIAIPSVLGALDDAGVTIKDMEALYCGCLFESNRMVGQRILQEVGQTGIPVVNVANACA
ncbi:MAG: thiolase family protein, partial [Alphaproteobacteria bacterium]